HGRPRADSPLDDLFAADRAVCLERHATPELAADLDAALARLGVTGGVGWRTAGGALPAATEMYRYRLESVDYLGLVRAPEPAAADEGPITIDLPAERWVYDCRSGESLGRTAALTLDVPVGDARFLALLPYRPERVTVSASVEGDALTIAASVQAPVTPSEHVLHVAVTPPGHSAPALCYTRNVAAPHGRAELTLPLGLDDPEGEWLVSARDVATGLRAETRVTLTR
ncbi:MAG: hypothetical protein J7M38_06660, partial [Armatimonadetes bacterium]|nr:hypothetical protein [Armatimonadota bacterium]